MVHTIRTKSVNRGRGRGRGAGGRRVPGQSMSFGLGPNGGSVSSRHSDTNHSGSHSSGHKTKGNNLTNSGDPSSRAPCHRESSYDPYEEYTQSSPKTYEMEEKIETLQGEIGELKDRLSMSQGELATAQEKVAKLRDKLAYSRWDNDRTKSMLHNLQQANFKALTMRDKLQGERDLLKLILAQERRIAARSWRTRMKDRTRFYKMVTCEYTGLMKGYLAAWVHTFKMGPSMSPLWKFKPSVTFAQSIRDPYLPEEP